MNKKIFQRNSPHRLTPQLDNNIKWFRTQGEWVRWVVLLSFEFYFNIIMCKTNSVIFASHDWIIFTIPCCTMNSLIEILKNSKSDGKQGDCSCSNVWLVSNALYFFISIFGNGHTMYIIPLETTMSILPQRTCQSVRGSILGLSAKSIDPLLTPKHLLQLNPLHLPLFEELFHHREQNGRCLSPSLNLKKWNIAG